MPDIDVLEAAIAAANENEEEKKPPATGDKGPESNDNTLDGVPALTLDAALEEKRNRAAAVSPQTAEELGKAESLKDLTDTMAETLFGNAEFEAIAAEVVANPPPEREAPAKIESDSAGSSEPDKDALAAAAEKDPSLVLELVEDTAVREAKDPLGSDTDIQMSTTRRFDLIKQLNSGSNSFEEIALGDTHGSKATPKKDGAGPGSLEEQFQTEMTATLKAIDSGEAPAPDADEDEPKKKTGLFSRFSRSS